MSGDFCYIFFFFVRQLNLKLASLVRLTDHRGLIGKSLATGFSCGYWDLNLASTFLTQPSSRKFVFIFDIFSVFENVIYKCCI